MKDPWSIAQDLLGRLHTADYWFVGAFALITFLGWHYFGSTVAESPSRGKQLRFVGVIALLVGVWLTLRWTLTRPTPIPPSMIGVVILEITGDDSHSLQRELAGALDAAMEGEGLQDRVTIRQHREHIDETLSLREAKQRAEEIGKQMSADLVIWGQRVGERKFYPKMVLVGRGDQVSATSPVILDVSVALPETLVSRPLALVKVIVGYDALDQGDFYEAGGLLQAASREESFAMEERVSFASLAAYSYYLQFEQPGEGSGPLEQSITLYRWIAEAGTDWQIKLEGYKQLATAFYVRQVGNYQENMSTGRTAADAAFALAEKHDDRKEIAHCRITRALFGKGTDDLEAALSVLTKESEPVSWALVGTSLALRLMRLPPEDAEANAQRALKLTQEAHDIFVKADDENGLAYCKQAMVEALVALARDISDPHAQKALAMIAEAGGPTPAPKPSKIFARAQVERGMLYNTVGKTAEHFQVAANSFKEAVAYYRKEDYPHDWAHAQVSYASALFKINTIMANGIGDALPALHAAEVFRESLPQGLLADLDRNLGYAYSLQKTDRTALLRAKKYLEAAARECPVEDVAGSTVIADDLESVKESLLDIDSPAHAKRRD